MTVKEIKTANNTSLIATLCLCMFQETKQSLITQKRISAELESRKIIESADELNKILTI